MRGARVGASRYDYPHMTNVLGWKVVLPFHLIGNFVGCSIVVA